MIWPIGSLYQNLVSWVVRHQNKVYRLPHPFSPLGYAFRTVSLRSLFTEYCALHCWISFGVNISSLLRLYTLFSTKLSTRSSGVVSISAWKQTVQVKLLKISLVWCSAFIWTPRTPPPPRGSTTEAHPGKALLLALKAVVWCPGGYSEFQVTAMIEWRQKSKPKKKIP